MGAFKNDILYYALYYGTIGMYSKYWKKSVIEESVIGIGLSLSHLAHPFGTLHT